MAIRDQIQRAVQEALKTRQEERLSTLRLLWAAIRNEEIDTRKELTDAEAHAVLARQLKQLKDAAADFERAGRTDLLGKAQKEMAIVSEYLPAQMTDEELRAVVEKVIAGAEGQTDAGKLIGAVMKEVKGKADGGRVKVMIGNVLT